MSNFHGPLQTNECWHSKYRFITPCTRSPSAIYICSQFRFDLISAPISFLYPSYGIIANGFSVGDYYQFDKHFGRLACVLKKSGLSKDFHKIKNNTGCDLNSEHFSTHAVFHAERTTSQSNSSTTRPLARLFLVFPSALMR